MNKIKRISYFLSFSLFTLVQHGGSGSGSGSGSGGSATFLCSTTLLNFLISPCSWSGNKIFSAFVPCIVSALFTHAYTSWFNSIFSQIPLINGNLLPQNFYLFTFIMHGACFSGFSDLRGTSATSNQLGKAKLSYLGLTKIKASANYLWYIYATFGLSCVGVRCSSSLLFSSIIFFLFS